MVWVQCCHLRLVNERSDHWINDMKIFGDLVSRSFHRVVGKEG